MPGGGRVTRKAGSRTLREQLTQGDCVVPYFKMFLKYYKLYGQSRINRYALLRISRMF